MVFKTRSVIIRSTGSLEKGVIETIPILETIPINRFDPNEHTKQMALLLEKSSYPRSLDGVPLLGRRARVPVATKMSLNVFSIRCY